MCGIYGQWNVSGQLLDIELVQQATTLLRHRGPDDEGYLLGNTGRSRYLHCAGQDTQGTIDALRIEQCRAEQFDFAFGFRRLSILDLSSCGHQPMASADGRHWIVFNGEIYNYRELRSELLGHGHTFRGGSDTEVILAAFQQWGPECLQRFNGMWAFAIWDVRERSLFLARDRFGVKPLHYLWDGARFAFASEIKALVGIHGVPFEPADEAIYEYLLLGGLPSPTTGRTFFREVHALPPAHFLTLSSRGLSQTRYYSLPASYSREEGGAAQAVAEYRELFIDAVRKRLRSDVPVGTCLSGGVDSSSITCVINRLMLEEGVAGAQLGDRQKTFSAVYRSAGRYNEREYIETVLSTTGAEPNFTFPTGEQLCSDLSRLIWHQDEPFGSSSIFAQWCVMAKVRERGVTVLLDGQGADEALGGYRPYDFQVAELLRKGRIGTALAATRQMNETTGLSQLPVWGRALAKQAPRRYVDLYRQLRGRRRAALLRGGLPNSARQGAGSPGRGGSLADHLRELITETSLPHLLRYEDRNGMAFSVEGRVPFVDYRLVEYSLTRGHPWCIRQGWTKWVLREAMADLVPKEILWRRDKVGFETPEGEWLQTCLTRMPDLFHDAARIGKYIDPGSARELVGDWLSRKGSTGQVWRLVNLELWLQTFSSSRVRSEV